MSNSNEIQSFYNIALTMLLNAPPYESNHTLHTNLNLKTLNEKAKLYLKMFHNRITTRGNSLAKNLASATVLGNPPRRLKCVCVWCHNLLRN